VGACSDCPHIVYPYFQDFQSHLVAVPLIIEIFTAASSFTSMLTPLCIWFYVKGRRCVRRGRALALRWEVMAEFSTAH
jgi:hypothetical protein